MDTVVNNNSHPLTELLLFYYDNYRSLRREHEDLDNFVFHKQFGLLLGVPQDWPLIKSLARIISSSVNKSDEVVVIYPSTAAFKMIHGELSEDSSIVFFAWQEMYVAINRANKDTRELQRFRGLLQQASLTIFLGPPDGVPEIVDHVRGFCEGCLIIVDLR